MAKKNSKIPRVTHRMVQMRVHKNKSADPSEHFLEFEYSTMGTGKPGSAIVSRVVTWIHPNSLQELKEDIESVLDPEDLVDEELEYLAVVLHSCNRSSGSGLDGTRAEGTAVGFHREMFIVLLPGCYRMPDG